MRWLALLVLAGAVVAQERVTVGQRVDEVLAAAGAAAKLRSLADQSQPAHWTVADELSSRGEHGVAIAYARASTRQDREQLAVYLESRRAKPTPKGTWAKLGPLWRRAYAGHRDVPAEVEPYTKLEGYPGHWATVVHAVALFRTGDARAEALLRRALAGMKKVGCRDDAAWAHYWLAVVRPDEAEAHYRKMIELEPHPIWRNHATHHLAEKLSARGDVRGALKLLDELRVSIEKSRDPDVRKLLPHLLAKAGVAAAALGRADARALLERARDLARTPADKVTVSIIMGNYLTAQGEYESALKYYERARSLTKRLNDKSNETNTLCGIAEVHEFRGDYEAARRWYEEALASNKSLRNTRGVARCWIALGNLRFRVADCAGAERYFEQVLRLPSLRGDDVLSAVATSGLANTYGRRGNSAKALELHARAAAMNTRLGRVAGAAVNQANIASIHRSIGNYDQALTYARKALVAAESLGARPLIASTLAELAKAHRARGEPEKALAQFERALALEEALGRRAEVAHGRLDMGLVYDDLHRYREAVESVRRALQFYETAGDRNGMVHGLITLASVAGKTGDPAAARSTEARALALAREIGARTLETILLNNIGARLADSGRAAEGLEKLERALALAREIGSRRDVAQTLNNIGKVYRASGDAERAVAYGQQARELYRAMGSVGGEIEALNNLANAHEDRDAPDEAFVLRRRALALAEKRGRVPAYLLANVALDHYRRREYEEALRFFERIRKIDEDRGEKSAHAGTWCSIGAVRAGMGDHEGAAAALERSRALASELGATDTELQALLNLAGVYAKLGRTADALAAARDGVALLPLVTGRLDDEHAAMARTEWRGLFANGVVAAVGARDSESLLFFAESAQAGALLESLGNRAALREAAVPPELRDAERKARARETTARKRYGRAVDRGERGTRKLYREVKAARADVLAAVAKAERAAKLRSNLVYPRPVALRDVQATLREGEAFVVCTASMTVAVALVIEQDRAYPAVFGKLDEIRKEVAAFRRAAGRAGVRGLELPPHERVPYLRKRLRKLLIEPLRLREGIKRVFVAPVGDIAYLPFAALDDREVVFVPSATTYKLLRDEARGKRGEKVLALGDPTSGRRLPASAYEARAVGDTVLLREDATVAKLEEALGTSRWRAVHFACHGHVHPRRPLLASLELTGRPLRCLDVFRMKISADLAVLSACETGKGKVYQAEGVVGFTRAFLFAGTPRVIVSLWKVDDEATKALMVKFYELWSPSAKASEDKHPQPAATALKNAQKHVASQEKWKHPYYWAAWQLWGLPE